MAETIDNDAFVRRRRRRFLILVGAAVLATIVGVALLMNIFERKQEARNPFYRVVELTDDTDDPAVWGKNFPLQYDDYKRTVDQVRTRFGGRNQHLALVRPGHFRTRARSLKPDVEH
jgi:nitrite reductase (cytochrome c-552)